MPVTTGSYSAFGSSAPPLGALSMIITSPKGREFLVIDRVERTSECWGGINQHLARESIGHRAPLRPADNPVLCSLGRKSRQTVLLNRLMPENDLNSDGTGVVQKPFGIAARQHSGEGRCLNRSTRCSAHASHNVRFSLMPSVFRRRGARGRAGKR